MAGLMGLQLAALWVVHWVDSSAGGLVAVMEALSAEMMALTLVGWKEYKKARTSVE